MEPTYENALRLSKYTATRISRQSQLEIAHSQIQLGKLYLDQLVYNSGGFSHWLAEMRLKCKVFRLERTVKRCEHEWASPKAIKRALYMINRYKSTN